MFVGCPLLSCFTAHFLPTCPLSCVVEPLYFLKDISFLCDCFTVEDVPIKNLMNISSLLPFHMSTPWYLGVVGSARKARNGFLIFHGRHLGRLKWRKIVALKGGLITSNKVSAGHG